MKKLSFVFVALAALSSAALSGCGSDSASTPASICDRAAAATKKFAVCFPAEPSPPEMPAMMAMPAEKCSETGCTDADKMKAKVMLDCIEAVPACAKGKELETLAKLGDCQMKAGTVSMACKLGD